MEIQRKLASVQRIAEVKPIEGADAIEAVRVNGWWVVAKKGEFKEGSLCVYFEIDSWVPHEVAPFLTKGKEPREFEGVKGERLRTIRLRGQMSQGLVLPVSEFNGRLVVARQDEAIRDAIEGEDMTEFLGVKKWEKPIPAQLAGQVKGNFPVGIPKTDQARIQNLSRDFEKLRGHTWEITEKLHGASCTFHMDEEGEFHVCSRNLDLKYDENNAYWKAAIKYDVENKLRVMHNAGITGLAIQGELVGEGINGNQYKTDLDFYVFDIYSNAVVDASKYCDSENRLAITDSLGLKHAPVIYKRFVFRDDESIESLLELAKGTSILNNSKREGLVFKSLDNPEVSFKVVSDEWLLEND